MEGMKEILSKGGWFLSHRKGIVSDASESCPVPLW